MNEFQKFLNAEMKNRDMSMRQFAEFVGVPGSVITRIMDQNSPTKPTVDTLAKIAIATSVDIRYIVGLVAPNGIQNVSTDAMTIMCQINRLPKDKQAVILQVIESMLTENRQTAAEQ